MQESRASCGTTLTCCIAVWPLACVAIPVDASLTSPASTLLQSCFHFIENQYIINQYIMTEEKIERVAI